MIESLTFVPPTDFGNYFFFSGETIWLAGVVHVNEAQNCEISCGNIHRECDEKASWPANREEIAAAARSVGFTCSSFSETIFQKIPKMQWLGQTASHHQVDCAYTKSSCSPEFSSCSRCTTEWREAGLRLCPCAAKTTTVSPNVVNYFS